MTSATSMATGDELPIVASPAGTPTNKQITRANFMGGTNITQVVGTTETQTLTNKTLTAPIIATISNTGTLTLPTSTDTLVGKATTDTLTNKTLTSPTINTPTIATPTFSGTASGSLTSLALTTPTLGVATATSINKVAITAPASSATLTIANGKTLTVNNTLTLAGTDSTVMTFPSTTATIARTDAAQTFTGTQTFSQVVTTNNAITASGNAATVPITSRLSTVTNNSAATLTITITTTSAVDGQMLIVRVLDSSAVAQTITWVNTENSTVTAPTTSNGSTTLFLTVGFIYNAATSKWRCVAAS